MTATELIALTTDGLVEVGAHTMTHSVLSQQSMEAQRSEIEASKHALEDVVGSPVPSFSYPFGGRDHYSAATVSLVRAAGFSRACSNFPGLVYLGTDSYQLPRLLVRDWSGEEFARRLSSAFRV